MVGLYVRRMVGNLIFLPDRWHREGNEWMWNAVQAGNEMFLKCTQKEQGGKHKACWLEAKENSHSSGRMICMGRILFLPKVLTQYMKRTRQDLVVLVGVGTVMEIWPGKDYTRAESQCKWDIGP